MRVCAASGQCASGQPVTAFDDNGSLLEEAATVDARRRRRRRRRRMRDSGGGGSDGRWAIVVERVKLRDSEVEWKPLYL